MASYSLFLDSSFSLMIVLICLIVYTKVSAFFLISEVFGGIYLRRGVFARLGLVDCARKRN